MVISPDPASRREPHPDFTAGGLRHWAYRLRRNPGEAAGAKRARSKAGIELARVVRTPERAVSARGSSHTGETPVVVELGLVRVAVTRGFDDDTLAAVLRLVARLSTGAAS